MISRLTVTLGAALLLVAIAATVKSIIDLPVVAISASQGRCVAVYPESAGSCDDLPERYEAVWVK